MTNKLTEEERETSGSTLAVIVLAVLIVWGIFKWLDVSMEAVNALFSGLAFATLIFTVFLQRRELQLQRQELADTRRELERSASAQEASEAALRAQADAAKQSADFITLNSLLAFYKEEILMGKKNAMHMFEPVQFLELQNREKKLLKILDTTYHQVTEHTAN